MSEMIERVARAIVAGISAATKDNHDIVLSEEDGKVLVDGWCDYKVVARAAISAMREPTEAMIDAGKSQDCVPDWNDQASAGQHWAAMISAALKETP